MIKIFARLEKIRGITFLILTSFIFFLFRLPSFFEPYWYGDEGIYQVLGMAMRRGSLLYRDIWDNKPPLLYTLYAIFNSDQFTIRIVSAIFGILTIFIFFKLTEELFLNQRLSSHDKKNQNIVYITTFIFAVLFGLPLLEGNIANSENFMLLPITLAALLINKSVHSYKNITLALTGFFLSLAFLFKVVAIFDFSAFLFFLIIINFAKEKKYNVLKTVNKLIPFFIGFVAPILLITLFFIINGAFWDFFNASFKQNVGYIGYGNKLIIPQGLLLIKLILLAFVIIFLFVKRHAFSASAIFIILWFSFSVFNAFFSQRPYTHYMLVLLPSFILLFGYIFSNPSLRKENTQTLLSSPKKISAVFLIIVLFLLIKNFNFYEKTSGYYQNFISFITMKKNVTDYRSFFDRNTPKDYELAQFIKLHSKPEDKIFIWGNNAQLYKLTNKLPPGRYTVAYHITASKDTLEETEKSLEKAKPRYIVVSSSASLTPFNLTIYNQKIIISNAIVYERIF
ncbi:MAG: glycosyltransferase family 39 protein [Candidatus Levybacteria bacterium]|nr:glycosyltransferase family 39 protein [Candidatus Levybacteria bacterium]